MKRFTIDGYGTSPDEKASYSSLNIQYVGNGFVELTVQQGRRKASVTVEFDEIVQSYPAIVDTSKDTTEDPDVVIDEEEPAAISAGAHPGEEDDDD